MIIVEDVHKRYTTEHGVGPWVLKGINLTIPPNVNVGLIGRNGAGKSTLLRLIGGIDKPSRGRVERQCRVSWPIGKATGLPGTLTGRQNAKFVCRLYGREEDIPDRIAAIEGFAELGSYFDEPVNTYSSGMRARLQLGISLAFDFDVYLADEASAAATPASRTRRGRLSGRAPAAPASSWSRTASTT
jgi:capsular polysaccharide transport system ATP-binding protein